MMTTTWKIDELRISQTGMSVPQAMALASWALPCSNCNMEQPKWIANFLLRPDEGSVNATKIHSVDDYEFSFSRTPVGAIEKINFHGRWDKLLMRYTAVHLFYWKLSQHERKYNIDFDEYFSEVPMGDWENKLWSFSVHIFNTNKESKVQYSERKTDKYQFTVKTLSVVLILSQVLTWLATFDCYKTVTVHWWWYGIEKGSNAWTPVPGNLPKVTENMATTKTLIMMKYNTW